MSKLDDLTYDDLEKAKKAHTEAITEKIREEKRKKQQKEIKQKILREEKNERLLDNANSLSYAELLPDFKWGKYIHENRCCLIRVSDLLKRIKDSESDRESEIKLELMRLLLENKEYFKSIVGDAYCHIVETDDSSIRKRLPKEYQDILVEEHKTIRKGWFGIKHEKIECVNKYKYFIMFYNADDVETLMGKGAMHRVQKCRIRNTKIDGLCMIYESISSEAYESEYY